MAHLPELNFQLARAETNAAFPRSTSRKTPRAMSARDSEAIEPCRDFSWIDSLDIPCSGDHNRHRGHFYRGQTPSRERRIQNTEGSAWLCGGARSKLRTARWSRIPEPAHRRGRRKVRQLRQSQLTAWPPILY